MKGLKESDLRKNCSYCKLVVCHNNNIKLFQVDITNHIVNMGAVKRQAGLEMMVGGAVAIAQALGPNEDFTKPVANYKMLLCQDCFSSQPMSKILENVEPEA